MEISPGGFQPDGVDFGSVWLPMEKVVLGREAGRWANAIWLKMKKYEWLAWRQDARTCSLVELLCFLHNKLVKPAPEAHRLNFSAEAIAFFRAAVPLCRCTQLSTADQLYRSTCFWAWAATKNIIVQMNASCKRERYRYIYIYILLDI